MVAMAFGWREKICVSLLVGDDMETGKRAKKLGVKVWWCGRAWFEFKRIANWSF